MTMDVWVKGRNGNKVYLHGWKRTAALPLFIAMAVITVILGLVLTVAAIASPFVAAAAIVFGIVHWIMTGVNLVTILPLALGILYFAMCKVTIRTK